MTEGSGHITVRPHASNELGCVGDGRRGAAWNALKERFDGNTKDARRACRVKTFSKSIKPGGDPVDFIAAMDDLRLRLEDMEEEILDNTYADMLLNRDRSVNTEEIEQTATNFHIQDLCRKSSAPFISWRGAAIATVSSSVQCHHCNASGHLNRECLIIAQTNRPHSGKKKCKKRKGGDFSPWWCSYHKTATHRDAKCLKQKELHQLAGNLALLK